MFHHSTEYYDVGETIPAGRWGRLLRGRGGRHGHFFRESLWEHIRATEFSDRPSRLACAYAYDNEQAAQHSRMAHAQETGGWVPSLYRVEPANGDAISHRADVALIDDLVAMTDTHVAVERIRAYWKGTSIGGPVEVLVGSDLRVVEVLDRGGLFGTQWVPQG